jgi:hypothetical protein
MTRSDPGPAWTLRPAFEDVRTALMCGGALFVLFTTVYGTCNWITAQRGDVQRFYFDWELGIPFVPAMVCVYLSLIVTFFLPMFCLRGPALVSLSRRLAWGTVLAGLAFLLLPASLGFERRAEVPGWEAAFRLLHLVDHPHNLVPSMHIIWSGLILGTLRAASPEWARRLFELWFALICVSVVLVHQHHLIDVISGMLAAVAVAWAVSARERRDFPGDLRSTQVQGRGT